MNELLLSKIAALVEGMSLKELALERERLTALYRDPRRKGPMQLRSPLQYWAYVLARLPATYAVVCRVLEELKRRDVHKQIVSVLDVGAGPGTVALALAELQWEIQTVTQLERDAQFMALAQRLGEGRGNFEKTWVCQDVMRWDTEERFDLVVASYCLNELEEAARSSVIHKLWNKTERFLLLIEAGSSSNFRFLRTVREQLLAAGGVLVAPCPHEASCPLPEGDWCHFSVRLERSSLQRRVKGAALNYEDEKFSYLLFSKIPLSRCQKRVLKRPFKGEGFVKIQFCSEGGIEEQIISKRNKEQYSRLKKAYWGEGFFI